MKSVCPLCNGLYKIEFNCKRCNSTMIDKGPEVNYLDDYSPYLLDEVTHLVDETKEERCVHIFQCPNCNFKISYAIERKRF